MCEKKRMYISYEAFHEKRRSCDVNGREGERERETPPLIFTRAAAIERAGGEEEERRETQENGLAGVMLSVRRIQGRRVQLNLQQSTS